jgi:GTPase SAR1 family protein
MAIKLLIAGESNSGKTTLTKNLSDTLVVSHDGKSYPFAVPHVMVPSFDSMDTLIATVNEKIVTYKEKFDTYPKTIVIDSVSKIFDTVLDYCNTKHTGLTK